MSFDFGSRPGDLLLLSGSMRDDSIDKTDGVDEIDVTDESGVGGDGVLMTSALKCLRGDASVDRE